MQDNRELLIISISVTVLMLLLCSFIVFFVLRYRQRQNEFEKEKRMIRLEYEREGNKALLEMSDQTMKAISQEIHDNVGQTLSLAKLQVNTLTTENQEEHKKFSNELLTRAIQDLRDIGRLLSGNFVLENGLEKSIRRELDMIEASGKIKCDFISDINGHKFKEEHEVILFRCAQESLNNILKYAKASQISLQLIASNGRLVMSIADNGIGFDVENAVKGLGIRNVQNRAAILGGTCHLKSSPGHGCKVLFDLPLQHAVSKIEN